MKTIYETTGKSYETQGDYVLPNIKIGDEKEYHIGVWDQRYRKYLKQNHKVIYFNYLTSGKLYEYLGEVDSRAEIMFNELVKSLAEKENVTEQLKATEPMVWVQKFNNIYLTFKSDEVTASVSKGEITGITVTPYVDKAYDGETHDAAVVEGTKEGDVVTYSTDDVDYSATVPTIKTPSSLTVYVKVVRSDKYEEYKQTVEASVINATIQGVEVKPYIGIYDGAAHPAVTVEGTKEGDIITFSTDGSTYSDVVPTIQDVGSKDIHVKVQREYHDDLPTPPAELKVTATVSQAEIDGVTADGYTGIYDRTSHDAITSVTGTIEGDVITYSDKEDGTYKDTIPTVKKVKDSGTYYVKVHRNDNYKDLIIPVTVSITKNDQQTISFGTTSDVTYNENNTFTYVIETRSADDAEGQITYKVVGGTANAEIKTSDKTTGKVTYTSVGTVKVEATVIILIPQLLVIQ